MNDFTEDDVRNEIANWRRHYRKVTLFKAAARVGLIILIGGGMLGVLYAFHM